MADDGLPLAPAPTPAVCASKIRCRAFRWPERSQRNEGRRYSFDRATKVRSALSAVASTELICRVALYSTLVFCESYH